MILESSLKKYEYDSDIEEGEEELEEIMEKVGEKNIKIFPHHKHISNDQVIESTCPTLSQVLDEIENLYF